VGTGREGTLRIPPSIADKLPAALDLRMAVLNANGKVYVVDKIYRLIP
jgi:predicted aspartyl protease